MHHYERYFFSILMLLLAAMLPSRAYGQANTASIVGTVRDSSGAVVPKITIQVRNEATNISRTATSSASGDYSVPLLQPGIYEVSANAPGFRKVAYSHITLEVNQTVRVDVGLTLGGLQSEVQVTAAAPLLQTDTSSVGQVVSQTQVSNLPLNQRNFVTFAYLAPGIQIAAQGTLDSTQGLALSANGARETANNFLIDGVDDNDLVINQYSALPPVDAIQEFKVQSGSYSAEYGRSAGAQINVDLKSGTNNYHGTAYEYVRNRHMDAKNVFDLPDCSSGSIPGTCGPIPRLDRSQFGGSFGGPIRHNKTFFFTAFEYLNLREAETQFSAVPSQMQLAAALAAVPPAQRNQAGVNILNLYPAANVGTNLSTSNEFVSAPNIDGKEPFFVVKIDHYFSAKDSLSGHYVLSFGDQVNPVDPLSPFTNLPGYGTTVLTHGQNGGITWTHTFSPRVLNEFMVGFNRELGFFYQTDKTNHSIALGFPDTFTDPLDTGFPNVGVAGFSGIGQPENTPQDHPTETLHIADNFSWNPSFDGGKHQFKAGFEARHYWYSLRFDILARGGEWDFNGDLAPNSLDQLLEGIPSAWFGGVTSATNMEILTTSYDGYFQDDYHVSPRLTLNLGVRYEYNQPDYDTLNQFSVPDLSSASATCTPKPNCQWIVAGTDGLTRSTYYSDWGDIAPRIGFAWRPMATDRFVVRASYGIFTDITILNAQLSARLNPPFVSFPVVTNPGTLTIQTIPFSTLAQTSSTGTYMYRHYQDPYEQVYNLDMQYQPAHSWLLDVGYVGSRGVKLTGSRNINQPEPGGTPPYPQFPETLSVIDNSRDSDYNSLQVKLQKSTSHGLSFLSAYTFSRCIDDGSGLFGSTGDGGTPQYAYDLRAEKGLCNFNTNHRLVFSTVYQLPFGQGRQYVKNGFVSKLFGDWDLSAILTDQTGHPFTVVRGIPQSGTLPSGGSDRPNVVGDPNKAGPVAANPTCVAPTQVRTTTDWFNPCAFVAAPGAFGDEGRDALIGPGLNNLDFSIQREIPLRSEARRLQFTAQFFNLLNTPHYDIPVINFDAANFSSIPSSNVSATQPPRQIQLALRLIF